MATHFRVCSPTTPGYILPSHHHPLPDGFKRGMFPMHVAVSPAHPHAGRHFGAAGPQYTNGLCSKWIIHEDVVNQRINQIRNFPNTIWKVTAPYATARAIFTYPVGVMFSGGSYIPCTGIRVVINYHQGQPGDLITAYPVVAEGICFLMLLDLTNIFGKIDAHLKNGTIFVKETYFLVSIFQMQQHI